jgi:hypothetical protein
MDARSESGSSLQPIRASSELVVKMKLEEDIIKGWYVVPMEFFQTNYTWAEYKRRKDKGEPIELVR